MLLVATLAVTPNLPQEWEITEAENQLASMSVDKDLDRVILALYEGAGDPQRWKPALAGLAGALGGFGATFLLWDQASGNPTFAITDGYSEEVVALYMKHYAALDRPAQISVTYDIGKVLSCTSHIDDDFIRRSEYYNDFLIPNGGRYVMGVKLLEEAGARATIGFHRGLHRGPFEATHADALQAVTPHLQQATRLLQRVFQLETERAQFASALDKASFAVLIVGGDGRMIASNAAGEEIAKEGDGLKVVAGRVHGNSPACTAALRAAIAAAQATARGHVTQPFRTLAIQRRRSPESLVVVAAPLAAPAAARFGCTEPAVALFISSPQRPQRVPADWLSTAFGLTRAEARVASGLCDGKSLKDIAEEHGLTKNTVRAQMQSIFAKTGTNRQGELIRLALSMPGITTRGR